MPDNQFYIVVAEALSEPALAKLESFGRVKRLAACDRSTLIDAVRDCDALVVRTYAQVTSEVLDAARSLKVVGRAGIGLDNIDLQAARERGVQVVHTPAASTNAVAEHTVGLMLALERRIVLGDRMFRDGRFLEGRNSFVSRELRGLTLGVLGMGRIGQAVGRIASDGLGMRVIYNDILDLGVLPFSARSVEKSVLWTESDVLILHVPLTDLTRGLIDRGVLSRMKTTATLVNTSRGAVVDVAALADALRAGRPAGAAIDVHDPEPPGADYPLLDAPNCILTPHIASRTEAGLARMNDVVDDVIAVLRGEPPAYPAW